jgi:Protein of unknown function (DUF3551)
MYMTLPKRLRHMRMRAGLLVGAALFAGVGPISGSMPKAAAAAPTYPWCARYANTSGDCSFDTFQQCLDTLSGIGGVCQENPSYNGPPPLIGQPGGYYNYYNYAPRDRRRY